MTLFRVNHNKNYTCVNNFIITDKRISWRAKGIWLYAFSRPDNWTFHLNDLINQSTDGRDSVRQGLKELSDAGYLTRVQHRDKGKFKAEWTFFETPQIKESFTERENRRGFADAVNHPLSSTDPLLNTETTTAKDAAQAAAVFSCLSAIEIPQSEKEWLSSHYDEATVAHAVAYAINPKTVIKTSLCQVIKWACKTKPEIPPDEVVLAEEHKQIAKSVESRVLPGPAAIAAGSSKIEIYFLTGSVLPIVIEYININFKIMLSEAIKRFGVKLRPMFS